MKILTVDIGTGTQDIFLYDSRLALENGLKMVLPSPTMMIRGQIQEATLKREPVLLTGVTMGGGPCAWAAEDHVKAGLPLYATPDAARTLNDDLEAVREIGIEVVGEDETAGLASQARQIELRDLDLPAIRSAFDRFGVKLDDLAAVAAAVFDHGDAPTGISDRQFRFDYLDERIRSTRGQGYRRQLGAFAHLSTDVPPIMTRLQAVVKSAGALDVPLIVMDTAPAAVLGASFDQQLAKRERLMVANVGNFHTLAFRLGPGGIEGVFEHHTGLIDLPKLEHLLRSLADGSLKHQQVFDDHGHGALIYNPAPLNLEDGAFGVAVTGPRRSMMQDRSTLRPYFAVPFGDMMIAGCFGLLAASAAHLPQVEADIKESLSGKVSTTAPWD